MIDSTRNTNEQNSDTAKTPSATSPSATVLSNTASSNSAKSGTVNPLAIAEKIEAFLTPIVAEAGYEIVLLEAQLHRPKTIRLFIDHCYDHESNDHASENSSSSKAIGVNDCARVSRAIDEPLENYATSTDADNATQAWLTAGFELEVSSPGIDRPLRREKDFLRFTGREVRLSTFRPLGESEMKNPGYFQRNPKQKNYFGEICGFQAGEILLKISATMGSLSANQPKMKPGAKKSKNKNPKPVENEKVDTVHIPLSLVSKANLEPRYDLDDQLSDETTGEEFTIDETLDGPDADHSEEDETNAGDHRKGEES